MSSCTCFLFSHSEAREASNSFSRVCKCFSSACMSSPQCRQQRTIAPLILPTPPPPCPRPRHDVPLNPPHAHLAHVLALRVDEVQPVAPAQFQLDLPPERLA